MDRTAELLRIKKAVQRLYDEMGFSVIPCHHPMEPPPQMLAETGAWSDDLAGKRPIVAWKKYQQVGPSSDEVAEWFYGDRLHNVAIVTGPISRVVVVDLDDEEAVEWAAQSLPATPLRVATSRGEHWYYRWDSTRPVGNQARLNTGRRTLNADVRGEGGYVLGPGSRHRSGGLYLTRPNGDLWKPETLDTLPPFPREMFERDGEPPAPQRQNLNAVVGLERRLLAYVDKVEGKTMGERNNAAYLLSANLLVDFGADPGSAWNLVQEWNQRNDPPLPERELRATFQSAQKGGTHERGWKRDLDRRQRPTLRLIQGGAPPTAGNLALAPEPEAQPLEAADFKMIAWDEIPEGSGWEFILEPAIPRGAVTILSGDGGLGKSLLACRLVAALAAGYDLQDRILGRRFRSTVFFLEDSLGEVKRRLADSGHNGDGSVNVFDNRDKILTLSREHVLAVARSAERHGSDLVVLDPLVSAATAAGVDMNSPGEARAVVDLLVSVAKAESMAVLLVAHHNSQGTIQGGKAWSNAVRSHLAVYRHPLYRDRYLLLHAKNNCGEMGSLRYKIGEARSGVPSSAVVEIEGSAPTWSYSRFHEIIASKTFDPGGVREAVAFLRRQILPGMRREKRKLMDLAAADGIRMAELSTAAGILGVSREYVIQPAGLPDLLCWEMPMSTEPLP